MTPASSIPRFSVVVPTFQRRDLVVDCVRSLERQEFDGSYEVIVVVDGSTDGTAAALRSLELSTPLKVVEQPNRGASVARNHGAAAAEGELILFLDDDMEADPSLLAEHDRSHREGADAVMGSMPLHPGSPRTVISEQVKAWADEHSARLARQGAALRFSDLLTGQLSVRRDTFEELTGFDESFTAKGSFGGEDTDFGYRLIRSGRRVVFNPAAVSRQRYAITPRAHLRQWRQAGRAHAALVRKHPEMRGELQGLLPDEHGARRWIWRPLLTTPGLGRVLLALARSIAVFGVRNGRRGQRASRFFFAVKDAENLRGTIEGGGVPDGPAVCVLAYHAVEDLADDPVLAPYGVSPSVFAQQLDMVSALGYRFVNLDEALDALRGEAAQDDRLALVTFDDCYTSVLEHGVPVLQERGIPAVAFAVSGRLGGTNAWDREQGARELRLLDADGLRRLADAGLEIGSHSRSHRPLAGLPHDALESEIVGSLDDLEQLGLPRPRALAYPHGEHDAAARTVAADAGLEAAFSVRYALAKPADDRFALPRIEVARRDLGWGLRLKVAATRAPGPIARRVERRSLR